MKVKRFFLALFFSFLAFSSFSSGKKDPCPGVTEKEIKRNRGASLLFHEMKKKEEEELSSILSSLSPLDALSQIFLVSAEGKNEYQIVEYKDGEAVIPGGVILFSFNLEKDPSKVMDFISSIKGKAFDKGKIPPYVSLDAEGGLVNRLDGITSPLPSQKTVSSRLNPSQAFTLYDLQSKQMKALGLDMNIAPLAEASFDFNSDFLGSRSFGSLEKSELFSLAVVLACERNGISSVVKHFPGNMNTDPHKGLPVIELKDSDGKNLSAEETEEFLLQSFKKVLSFNPDCLLMSHAIVSAVDEKPSCLSSVWINDILRNKLNYKGLVISDDIFMAALAENGYPQEKAAILAVEAGVDVIMLSEKRFLSVAMQLLQKASEDSEFEKKLKQSEMNVLRFKKKHGLLNFEKNCESEKEKKLSDFYKAKEEGQLFYQQSFKLK